MCSVFNCHVVFICSLGGAVQLSCDSHRMNVVIDLEKFVRRFPDVDPTSLMLSDDRCQGTFDGSRTHLVWKFSLDACGTRRYVSIVSRFV